MRRARSHLLTLLAPLVAAGMLLPAAPAAAQAAEAAATLELASQTAWVRPGQDLALRLDLSSVSLPERIDILVRVHRAVATRSEFARTVEGEGLARTVVSLPAQRLTDLSYDDSGAVPLLVPLPDLATGVYPVAVSLRDRQSGGTIDTFVTHLVRVPEQATEPLRVAWVQPIAGPLATQPDGDVDLEPDEVARLARIVVAVAGQPSLPVTFDITPETAEALVAARPDLQDDVRALVSDQERRQLLAAPLVDVDASALVAAGLDDDLGHQRNAGGQTLQSVVARTGDRRVWSSSTPLSTAAVGRLLTMDVAAVVVPEGGLSPLSRSATGGKTLAQPFALADPEGRLIDAVAADGGLAAHLEEEDEVLGAHHLLADLAVLYLDAPLARRGVAVRPPDEWDAPRAFLEPLLAGLAGAGVVRPVTVSTLVADVTPLQDGGRPVVRTVDAGGASLSPTVVEAIRDARGSLAGTRSMTGDDEGLRTLDRVVLLSEADGLSDSRRLSYLAAVGDAASTVRGGVRLANGRTFRLTAREGTIPLTLVNDNPFPVTVSLELSSDKLEFVDAPGNDRSRMFFANLELEPSQRRVIAVDVRARTSAAFPLRAVLRSPSGDVELGEVRYTVISTALSGVGIALSVGAVLVLAWWWIRHWRRVRREPQPAAAAG